MQMIGPNLEEQLDSLGHNFTQVVRRLVFIRVALVINVDREIQNLGK